MSSVLISPSSSPSSSTARSSVCLRDDEEEDGARLPLASPLQVEFEGVAAPVPPGVEEEEVEEWSPNPR